MWKILLQIFFSSLVGCAFGRNQPVHEELGTELSDRLNILEELVASQIESQETLRAALRRETERRLTLESLLERTFQEERAKVEDLTSILKVTSDRAEALDLTFQEEVRLREEAEITGGQVILELSKKVGLVERDLSLLSLIKSRLRELEDQEDIQNEEIQDLTNTISNVRKSITREHKELQQLQSNIEALGFTTTEHNNELPNFDTRIQELLAKLLDVNETVIHESTQLREVKTNVLQLTSRLTEIKDSITNLTRAVGYLHQKTPKTILKLCPQGYRKVGEDCLQLVQSKLSWEDARKKCEELGIGVGGIGDLIIPNHMDEFRAYVERLNIAASDYLWVGAKRDDDKVWRWLSGMTLQERDVPWDLGEPDNFENQYHLCIRTNGNLKFHDCLADAQLGAVCQLS